MTTGPTPNAVRRRTRSTTWRGAHRQGDRDALETPARRDPAARAERVPRRAALQRRRRGRLPGGADQHRQQDRLLGRQRPVHDLDARGRGELRADDVPADEEPGAGQRRRRCSSNPDPRTTSVIAGTRLDLLEAMETIERDHPQYVEPLLLRDVYGMSYEEIAQQVDAPLGTVKAQIHHGRKLARPLLRGNE